MEIICMFWVGVWGFFVGWLVCCCLFFCFFLETLLCSNSPIIHGFRGFHSFDNSVFPEINGNSIVDLRAKRLPFTLRHRRLL